MSALRGYFVTGTDTGVGKTCVTAALVAIWRGLGVTALPMKPIQTGAACEFGALRSPDLDFCLNSCGLRLNDADYALASRYRFETPCSPHLAARMAGATIAINNVRADCEALALNHDALVVEGAGGLLVPINEKQSMLDLMVALALPVVVVARPTIGTLNHTLLTLAELRRHGLEIAGVVLNDSVPMEWGAIEYDNLETIQRLGKVNFILRLECDPALNVSTNPDAFMAAISDAAGFRTMLQSRPVSLDIADMWQRDVRSVWHPYTRHSALKGAPFPNIVRGQGPYLFDAAGKRYFDAIASWWACSLGHGHPRLVRAMQDQAGRLQHSILGRLSHPGAVELADRLCALMPTPERRVVFASDGSCAIEAALKIAVQYQHNLGRPERCRFATLTEGYHGDTIGAVSVGYVPSFHAPYRSLLFDAFRADSPCCGKCAWGRAPETCGVECFESMQRILETHAAELAGVIIEPLCQGSAGMRIYSQAYLRKLAEACRFHDVPLIVDEIAMGFGRTGRFFAFEHAGIDPDIVCVGKALGGGYLPISAAIVRQSIFETFSDDATQDCTFYHGHTFGGNPIACALALETLRIYNDERIVEQAAALGECMQKALAPFRDMPEVINVRGLGAIGVVELGPDPVEGAVRAQKVRQVMLDQGVLIRPLGPVLYLLPPLITPHALILDTARLMARALFEQA